MAMVQGNRVCIVDGPSIRRAVITHIIPHFFGKIDLLIYRAIIFTFRALRLSWAITSET
jgi:hypothetical protein